MGASVVYRSAALYELVMLALYGRHYGARYRAIAALIPDGCRVVDLCCGPGVLFERYLRAKGVEYTGVDLNPRFVDRVARLGGKALRRDLSEEGPLPEADFVVMQASLYHFLPDAAPVVRRMRAAARVGVIVAEPVRNLADSPVPLVAVLARRLTDPGPGAPARRFTEPTLDALFASLPPPPRQSFLIPGGREKVYVLDPAG